MVINNKRILIHDEDTACYAQLSQWAATGEAITHAATLQDLEDALTRSTYDLVLLSLSAEEASRVRASQILQQSGRSVPVIVLAPPGTSPQDVSDLLGLRLAAILATPLDPTRTQEAIERALDQHPILLHQRELEDDLLVANRRLNERLQELNTIYTVGKSVTSSLDVDEILERIVVTSVNLTQADEGFIILRDGEELSLRIAKRAREAQPRHLHTPISDAIAWQVIRSGYPTMLGHTTSIATNGHVQALLYVPMNAPTRGSLGVLGVVNRQNDQPFSENHLFALSSAADFAAIALENARLYGIVQTEHSRLSAVLEHAAEGIIITDTANRLRLWSETAARLFKIPPDAAGQPVDQHIDSAPIRDMFRRAQRGEKVQHTEVELQSGEVLNAQLSSVDQVGRVAVMQDITHLKELDRLKSEFVSMVSHDLRTPLTTIQGYIELLDRGGPLTELQQSFIQKALNSLRQITLLISDLLDIGRIEAGYDLEMDSVRLDEIIRQAVTDHALDMSQGQIECIVNLPEAPLWVRGNAPRLRQVLDNLISNAVKYNRPGGWIRISARPDGSHAVVSVVDNGIGIPPSEQPRVFERFYRVQSPETENIRGTGLGLAIVKSVVEKHKGRIWLESTPGGGSTFVFILPLHSRRSKNRT